MFKWLKNLFPTKTKSFQEIYHELLTAYEASIEHMKTIKLENDDLVVLAEIFQPVENLTEAETKIRLEHLSRIVETSYIANVDIIYSKLFELRKDISSLTKKDYDKAQFLIHSIFSNWDFEQQRHAKNIIAQIQLVNMGFIPNPYFPPVIGSPVKGEH